MGLSESLNALYVYEAKMSLLIKIAQTRQGADRLQDARVLSVLAQCDFLNARPEKDIDFRSTLIVCSIFIDTE